MDTNTPEPGPATALPAEAVAFAGRMFNAAREGDLALFQQALPAGLPANLTNDKGDTLVCLTCRLLHGLHLCDTTE